MSDFLMDLAHAANTEFDWLKMFSDGPGANLFVNDMPPLPNFAISFIRYGGMGPDATFGKPLAIRNPSFQVMVRDPYSEVTIERQEDLMGFLTSIVDQTIGGTDFQKIELLTEITELGPDSSKRERATVNYRARFEGEQDD